MGENGGGGMGENEREGRETGRDCVGEGVLGRKREGVLSARRRAWRWAFGVYWLSLSLSSTRSCAWPLVDGGHGALLMFNWEGAELPSVFVDRC
jgi:hypothetical protein